MGKERSGLVKTARYSIFPTAGRYFACYSCERAFPLLFDGKSAGKGVHAPFALFKPCMVINSSVYLECEILMYPFPCSISQPMKEESVPKNLTSNDSVSLVS